jgi:hypothetical protein
MPHLQVKRTPHVLRGTWRRRTLTAAKGTASAALATEQGGSTGGTARRNGPVIAQSRV